MATETTAKMRKTWLLHGAYLLGVAVLIVGFGIPLLGWHVGQQVDQLNELKTEINRGQAMLGELEKKTWGLELIEFSDGGRGIILPKGLRLPQNHLGDIKDGRQAIILPK